MYFVGHFHHQVALEKTNRINTVIYFNNDTVKGSRGIFMRTEVSMVTEISWNFYEFRFFLIFEIVEITVHRKSRRLWQGQAGIALDHFQSLKNRWTALNLEDCCVLKVGFVPMHVIHVIRIYRKMGEYGDQKHLNQSF